MQCRWCAGWSIWASRRVAFVLRVAYGTAQAQITAVPAMIREIVRSRCGVDLECAHFFRYGDWSLDFEVIYHF